MSGIPNPSKKVSILPFNIGNLPYDCLCHCISFYDERRSFFSLCSCVKGLLTYVEDVHPHCTRNIYFQISRLPKSPKLYITAIKVIFKDGDKYSKNILLHNRTKLGCSLLGFGNMSKIKLSYCEWEVKPLVFVESFKNLMNVHFKSHKSNVRARACDIVSINLTKEFQRPENLIRGLILEDFDIRRRKNLSNSGILENLSHLRSLELREYSNVELVRNCKSLEKLTVKPNIHGEILYLKEILDLPKLKYLRIRFYSEEDSGISYDLKLTNLPNIEKFKIEGDINLVCDSVSFSGTVKMERISSFKTKNVDFSNVKKLIFSDLHQNSSNKLDLKLDYFENLRELKGRFQNFGRIEVCGLKYLETVKLDINRYVEIKNLRRLKFLEILISRGVDEEESKKFMRNLSEGLKTLKSLEIFVFSDGGIRELLNLRTFEVNNLSVRSLKLVFTQPGRSKIRIRRYNSSGVSKTKSEEDTGNFRIVMKCKKIENLEVEMIGEKESFEMDFDECPRCLSVLKFNRILPNKIGFRNESKLSKLNLIGSKLYIEQNALTLLNDEASFKKYIKMIKYDTRDTHWGYNGMRVKISNFEHLKEIDIESGEARKYQYFFENLPQLEILKIHSFDGISNCSSLKIINVDTLGNVINCPNLEIIKCKTFKKLKNLDNLKELSFGFGDWQELRLKNLKNLKKITIRKGDKRITRGKVKKKLRLINCLNVKEVINCSKYVDLTAKIIKLGSGFEKTTIMVTKEKNK